MGDHWIYYLKAKFPSGAAARAAADEALPAFAQLEKLQRNWQKIREQRGVPARQRFETLLREHPLAVEFLPQDLLRLDQYEPDPGMNFLAWQIPHVWPGTINFDLVVNGDTLYLQSLSGDNSNWDRVAEWMKKRGATSVKWTSEEKVGRRAGPKDWKPRGATPFDKF